ncbi:MAG: hypothetical protein GXP29_06890, partial [Planctomycetes bacterium]|nr:hypothetical protein [Planctomycetota bacterium]
MRQPAPYDPMASPMTSFDTTEIGYNPPRFWWTKRIALASVGLAGLIVALVVGSTHVAQRRLDVLIESYRAKGEPVYVEDFNVFKDIPDEENAATYYKEAGVVYTWPASVDAEIDLDDLYSSVFDRESPRFGREIERFINTNGETIALLKRAAQCKDIEWGYVFTSPLLASITPNLK